MGIGDNTYVTALIGESSVSDFIERGTRREKKGIEPSVQSEK
jgi:hypothetical protein